MKSKIIVGNQKMLMEYKDVLLDYFDMDEYVHNECDFSYDNFGDYVKRFENENVLVAPVTPALILDVGANILDKSPGFLVIPPIIGFLNGPLIKEDGTLLKFIF